MKNLMKIVLCILVVCIVSSVMPGNSADAKSIRLSSKSITLYVGQTKTIKLKGTRKKPKWRSSKKSVATVTSKGKIKAKKKGSTVIIAKLGKKSYKCKVTVKVRPSTSKKPASKPSNTTSKPSNTAASTVSNNYRNLAKYLMKNGKYSSGSTGQSYYIDDIELLDDGSVYIAIEYYLDGHFEFVVRNEASVSSGTASSLLIVTITPPQYSKGAVDEIFVSSTDDLSYAEGSVFLSALSSAGDNITYTSTNAETADMAEALYQLGEMQLSDGLDKWNSLLKTSGTGLTLKDLGFIVF